MLELVLELVLELQMRLGRCVSYTVRRDELFPDSRNTRRAKSFSRHFSLRLFSVKKGKDDPEKDDEKEEKGKTK